MITRQPNIIKIFITDDETAEYVEAELWDRITEKNISDAKNYWQPYHESIREEFERLGADQSRWPQSGYWNWEKKFKRQNSLPEESNISYAIVEDDMTQAMMFAELTTTDKVSMLCQEEGPIVYINTLEVAPWNQKIEIDDTLGFSGCGITLMSAIITESMEKGANGRIGLHSLNQAMGFYEKLGLVDLGVDKKKEFMHYYEFTAQEAKSFILRKGKK